MKKLGLTLFLILCSSTVVLSQSTYKIHPAIGIARVGSSSEYYVASETWNPEFVPDAAGTGYRDAAGNVRRMACRFRIYEYDSNGDVEGEIDYAAMNVRWEVHVVNKKADKAHPVINNLRLNPMLPSVSAIIDPGMQSVDATSPTASLFGTIGTAPVQNVDLGRIVYEAPPYAQDEGPLLVVGGQGDAGYFTSAQPDAEAHHNAGWYDGTSDGRVTAFITLENGSEVEVDASAWVIVGPPDYAHGIVNLVTLWDIVRDRSDPPSTTYPSFKDEIYPIIQRVANLQWTLYETRAVSHGRMAMHGHGYAMNAAGDVVSASHEMHSAQQESDRLGGDFFADALWRQLLDPTFSPVGGKTIGEHVMERLKIPGSKGSHGPSIMGTAASMPPLEQLTLTPTQYEMMESWSAGNFNDDWVSTWSRADPYQNASVFFPDLQTLIPAEEPEALDKGALMSANGGAFAPGIEAGGLMAIGPDEVAEDDTGQTMNTYSDSWRIDHTVISPGDITQSLSVPWQAGMNMGTGNWWPASRPVLVLLQDSVLAGNFTPQYWTRPYTAKVPLVETDIDNYNVMENYTSIYQNQKMTENALMIRHWNRLGFMIPYRDGLNLRYVEGYRE